MFPYLSKSIVALFFRPVDSTMSDTLHRVFSAFGPIVEAAVIYDKHTKRSKGYGMDRFALSVVWCQCSSRVSFVFCFMRSCSIVLNINILHARRT